MPETLPVGPAPPTPRRLNNLALILLRLAGAVLLATVVYFGSQRPATPPRVAAPPPRPEAETVEPGFLHRPPRTPYAPQVPSPPPPRIQAPGGDAAGLAELATLDALARGQQPPGSPLGSTELGPGAPSAGAPGGSFSTHYPYSTGSGAYSSAPATPPSDPRRDAYLRALRASISISSPSTSAAAPAAGASAAFPGLGLPTLPALRIPGLTEPLPEQREPAPPPQQDPTAAFLTSTRAPRDPRLAVTVDPPLSATQLDAGSLIPAVLVTGINSDLAGDLVAQVSRDVFDSRAQRRVSSREAHASSAATRTRSPPARIASSSPGIDSSSPTAPRFASPAFRASLSRARPAYPARSTTTCVASSARPSCFLSWAPASSSPSPSNPRPWAKPSRPPR
jgi:hypothetical protein